MEEEFRKLCEDSQITTKDFRTNVLTFQTCKVMENFVQFEQGITLFFSSSSSRRLPMDIIKVSAHSRTSAVAGAIAGVFREHGRAEVQAIGAGAVNQSVKALVLAISYLKERDDIHIVCTPQFVDVEIEDKVRTAIKLVVENREGLAPTPEFRGTRFSGSG